MLFFENYDLKIDALIDFLNFILHRSFHYVFSLESKVGDDDNQTIIYGM